MRTFKHFSVAALSLFLIAALSGCCHLAHHSKQDGGLNGAWKFKDRYQGSYVLTFDDGSYAVDFDGDGNKDVWGRYELNWDEIRFTDKGGKIGEDCRESGKYQYNLSGNELKFKLVSDACASRVKSLAQLWVRK